MPLFDQAKAWIDYLARGVEFAAALIIALASIEATVKALHAVRGNVRRWDRPRTAVRLTLGRWLAASVVEFELAADSILRTAVTTSSKDIEQLAAIAALRTALNYFLEREIRQESKPEQRTAEDRLTAA